MPKIEVNGANLDYIDDGAGDALVSEVSSVIGTKMRRFLLGPFMPSGM